MCHRLYHKSDTREQIQSTDFLSFRVIFCTIFHLNTQRPAKAKSYTNVKSRRLFFLPGIKTKLRADSENTTFGMSGAALEDKQRHIQSLAV